MSITGEIASKFITGSGERELVVRAAEAGKRHSGALIRDTFFKRNVPEESVMVIHSKTGEILAKGNEALSEFAGILKEKATGFKAWIKKFFSFFTPSAEDRTAKFAEQRTVASTGEVPRASVPAVISEDAQTKIARIKNAMKTTNVKDYGGVYQAITKKSEGTTIVNEEGNIVLSMTKKKLENGQQYWAIEHLGNVTPAAGEEPSQHVRQLIGVVKKENPSANPTVIFKEQLAPLRRSVKLAPLENNTLDQYLTEATARDGNLREQYVNKLKDALHMYNLPLDQMKGTHSGPITSEDFRPGMTDKEFEQSWVHKILSQAIEKGHIRIDGYKDPASLAQGADKLGNISKITKLASTLPEQYDNQSGREALQTLIKAAEGYKQQSQAMYEKAIIDLGEGAKKILDDGNTVVEGPEPTMKFKVGDKEYVLENSLEEIDNTTNKLYEITPHADPKKVNAIQVERGTAANQLADEQCEYIEKVALAEHRLHLLKKAANMTDATEIIKPDLRVDPKTTQHTDTIDIVHPELVKVKTTVRELNRNELMAKQKVPIEHAKDGYGKYTWSNQYTSGDKERADAIIAGLSAGSDAHRDLGTAIIDWYRNQID